jgi:hypothetical protein
MKKIRRKKIMKDKKQDNRISLFYITERLSELTKIKSDKELRIKLDKFKLECVHNLGINALHNYNN